jgi:sugar phosphate isomerase/epimerase
MIGKYDSSTALAKERSLSSKIRFGLITDVIPLEEISDGWDYYEIPNALHGVPLESDANWLPWRERYRATGVPVLVASHYIQGFGTAATGPSYDREQQAFWAERSFRRLNELGVEVVGIFGRFFPEGADRVKAVDDALSFCNIVADQAETYGMLVALEPMGAAETLFPTYKEGLAFAKASGRRAIRVMADINYFVKTGEPLDDILEDPSYCVHVTIAGEAPGGSQPNVGPRTEQFRRLFKILDDMGYDRTVSAACPWVSSTGASTPDYRYETGVTLEYMRSLCA